MLFSILSSFLTFNRIHSGFRGKLTLLKTWKPPALIQRIILQPISSSVGSTDYSFPNAHLNITTYNVLSSSLSDPNYFIHCSSNYLDETYRFDRLKEKLLNKMNGNSIICLQELSTDWTGIKYKDRYLLL